MTPARNGPQMFLVQRSKGGELSIVVSSQHKQTVRANMRRQERDPRIELVSLDPEVVRVALRDYDDRVAAPGHRLLKRLRVREQA